MVSRGAHSNFLDRLTRSQLTGSHLAPQFAEKLPRIYVLYLAKEIRGGGRGGGVDYGHL